MSRKILVLASAATICFSTYASAASRDYISIVGSSTVYPFATVVAETFGKKTRFKTPKIESTGSGGGMKLFCSGVGVEHPDITNSSRRIKKSEYDKCQKNGVTGIIEVKVGYDGIAIANSKKAERMELSRKDIFLALAKDVPNPDGSETLVANPYKTWMDVNPALLKLHDYEPHWHTRSGRVMAYRRTSLFGLVLADKQRIHYGPVNPVEAREILIRAALVACDWNQTVAAQKLRIPARTLTNKVKAYDLRRSG